MSNRTHTSYTPEQLLKQYQRLTNQDGQQVSIRTRSVHPDAARFLDPSLAYPYTGEQVLEIINQERQTVGTHTRIMPLVNLSTDLLSTSTILVRLLTGVFHGALPGIPSGDTSIADVFEKYGRPFGPSIQFISYEFSTGNTGVEETHIDYRPHSRVLIRGCSVTTGELYSTIFTQSNIESSEITVSSVRFTLKSGETFVFEQIPESVYGEGSTPRYVFTKLQGAVVEQCVYLTEV